MIVPRCVLLGGGGHAAVVFDSICPDMAEIVGALLPNGGRLQGVFGSLPVLGDDDQLPVLRERHGISHFVLGLGAVADNRPRQALFEQAIAAGLQPLSVRHRSSVVSSRAKLGAGCQILPGAIVNAGATLGVNVIVNTGAIVEHDCDIADHVHIATGARLAGTVRIGLGVHVGAGATVLQKRTIGEWAVVGAGAVVTGDVDAGLVVVGVPARPLTSRRGSARVS